MSVAVYFLRGWLNNGIAVLPTWNCLPSRGGMLEMVAAILYREHTRTVYSSLLAWKEWSLSLGPIMTSRKWPIHKSIARDTRHYCKSQRLASPETMHIMWTNGNVHRHIRTHYPSILGPIPCKPLASRKFPISLNQSDILWCNQWRMADQPTLDLWLIVREK